MGMKPIASRSEGWVVCPKFIAEDKELGSISIYESFGVNPVHAKLPYDITFAQFLDQYNRCTDNIYFID